MNNNQNLPKEEKWKPKINDTYWYIGATGEFYEESWDVHTVDLARQSFLGVFETEEKAEARLSEIKALLI